MAKRQQEVAETATKPSPAPLQKHSADGCTVDMPLSEHHMYIAPAI